MGVGGRPAVVDFAAHEVPPQEMSRKLCAKEALLIAERRRAELWANGVNQPFR